MAHKPTRNPHAKTRVVSRRRAKTANARGESYALLQEAYRKSGLVIGIGAGISYRSRLPGWEELLRRLARRRFGRKGDLIFRNLRAHGHTLPAIAGILESSLPPGKDFASVLRDELYRSFPFYKIGVTDLNRQSFIRFVERNKTLVAVARLCAIRSSDRWTNNPKVHAIVNFNFDAVFRQYVGAKFGTEVVRTIERPSAGSVPNRIPIYHMHGFLQFDESRFNDLTEEAPDVRVFTEQEYFDFFNRPTTIYNYTFLHLLREQPFLFVGLSLMDDNIRRLLHYSRMERMESDGREGKTLESADFRSRRHFALYRKTSEEAVNVEIERSLSRLGVNVIWFEQFEDVPQLLDALTSAMPLS